MSKTLSGFMSINFLFFLFLPGIIIHELSHFLVAIILFVPVGAMEFTPKVTGNKVKLGSVEIGKTDPIRRSLIGFAPVFTGLLIIPTVIYLFSSNFPFFQNINIYLYVAIILVLTYFLFAVSNTMFSSSRDMEGTLEILITLFIIFVAAYTLGFRPNFSFLEKILTKELNVGIQNSLIFLLVPISLDLFILALIKLFKDKR